MSQSNQPLGSALVRYLDTPRLFINVYEEPKRKGLPEVKGEIHLSQKLANKALDSHTEYGKRTGIVVRGERA